MKKLLALILALTMAACVFISCAPSAPSTEPGTSDTSGTSGTSETSGTIKEPWYSTTTGTTPPIVHTTATTTPTIQTTATTKLPDVPELDNMNAVESIRNGYENVDFQGHTFIFAAPINTTDGWSSYEVCGEQDGAGLIDDSIAKRNELLKKHYNANIKVVDVNGAAIGNSSHVGDNNIDIVLSKYNLSGINQGTTQQGTQYARSYYNLHSLGIDFNKPWWDTAFINDTTIDGKMYAVLGAFSTTAFDATQVIYFNNTVRKNTPALKNVDFYDLVYNNEWTLDTFMELVRLARHDDGDGNMVLGTDDVFGYVSSSYNIHGLYFGAGQGYIKKTDSKFGGTTFESAFDQDALSVTDTIISIYSSDSSAITDYVNVRRMAESNLTLFTTETLKMATLFGGSSIDKPDLGILPFPKLNATQNDYNHNVDNHMIYLYVTTSSTNIAKIAEFLDLYAYHSYYTVYKDYITTHGEELTGNKKTTDMVDIILQSHYIDLVYHYNFGQNIDTAYTQGVRNALPSVWGSEPNPIYNLRSSASSITAAANSYRDKIQGLEA